MRALLALLLLAATSAAAEVPGFSEREVSFETEDGWRIHGTLSTPAGMLKRERRPALLMVHSPSHDRDAFAYGGFPYDRGRQDMRTLLAPHAFTLRIDIRGRGQSAEPKEWHEIARAGHNDVYRQGGLRYFWRLQRFFRKCLK